MKIPIIISTLKHPDLVSECPSPRDSLTGSHVQFELDLKSRPLSEVQIHLDGILELWPHVGIAHYEDYWAPIKWEGASAGLLISVHYAIGKYNGYLPFSPSIQFQLGRLALANKLARVHICLYLGPRDQIFAW